jgi:phage I-like protein
MIAADMQYFVLSEATLAVTFDHQTGKKIAVTIPAGAKVTAIDIVPLEPASDRGEQVAVTWEDRTVQMFLADLQERGQRVHSVRESKA